MPLAAATRTLPTAKAPTEMPAPHPSFKCLLDSNPPVPPSQKPWPWVSPTLTPFKRCKALLKAPPLSTSATTSNSNAPPPNPLPLLKTTVNNRHLSLPPRVNFDTLAIDSRAPPSPQSHLVAPPPPQRSPPWSILTHPAEARPPHLAPSCLHSLT